MVEPTYNHWLQLCGRMRIQSDVLPVWQDLERRYQEPHRAYHNLEHIGECFTEFAAVRSQALDPNAVELAIWFHDAIYDPRAQDNEERSGQLAGDFLEPMGLPAVSIHEVRNLIMATRHTTPPTTPDASLLTDIDLAILGQPPGRFAAFEQQIRQEYAWVPPSEFALGRAKILRGFLDRPTVYSTAAFRQKYEQRARTNLEWGLRQLGC